MHERPPSEFTSRNNLGSHGVSMRALWVTPGYPWSGNPVGFIFHQTQARAVAEAGIDITVMAPSPWVPPAMARFNPRWAVYRDAPRRQQDGRVSVERPRYLTTPRESRFGVAHLTQAFGLSRAMRPDVIHAHFAYPCGSASLALKRQFRVPLVLTVLGDDVNIYPYHNRRMRRLFVQAVRGADRVLANSPALATSTEELTGVRPDVLSIGVDVESFSAPRDRARIRTAIGVPLDAFVILFVGALLPQKGVLDLADALQRLAWPDAVGLFVGAGPAQPEGPGIRLLGPRPYGEIPDLLAAADVFVLPSWHEGLGQAAVEAGAAGVPVVAADTGGLADLVGKDRGYLFRPRDSGSLAAAFRQMRDDPADARRRADRLHFNVLAEHDLRANARHLAGIYRGLVADRTPS